MSTKTYVLLESMNAEAPVYQTTGDGQRSQVKKIPFHRPTLRQEFTDKDGNAKVIRYKSFSKFIDQDLQIEKEKLDANVAFTATERRDCEFRFATLTTNKVRAQEYLEAHPEFQGFDGYCENVRQPKYKLLDEAKEAETLNTEMRKRIKAANKIIDLELEDLQAMIIRLNGSFVETPNTKRECENMLMAFVDDGNENAVDAVLKEDKDLTVDDKTGVLIGRLLNAKLLSFDAVDGKISKKDKAGQWITVREMSSEYDMLEKMRLFSDFLNTDDGKALKNDLEKDLSRKK
ncbi:MAG: hypothetical protein ABIP51_22705 [Bacteroidia bacterium]